MNWLLAVVSVVAGLVGGVASGWVVSAWRGMRLRYRGPGTSRVVTAEAFCLAGGNGKLRAELFIKPNGAPAFTMHDASGRVRIALGMIDGAPRLILAADDGKTIWRVP